MSILHQYSLNFTLTYILPLCLTFQSLIFVTETYYRDDFIERQLPIGLKETHFYHNAKYKEAKAKARRSREADISSDIGNMDILQGNPRLIQNRLDFNVTSERN